MNHRSLLGLFAVFAAASPTLTLLLIATKVEAVELSDTDTLSSSAIQASCDVNTSSSSQLSGFRYHDRGVLIASSAGIVGDDSGIEFSEAESDAAVTLFGCDCSACMRSLKQLQSQSLTQKVLESNSKGHCWQALQRRTSLEVAKEVLKTLESQK